MRDDEMRRREFISDQDSREAWREAGREARRGGWRLGLVIVSVMAAIAVIGWGVWSLSVATSDVRGKGELHRQINAADNRRFAQEQFQTLLNDIKAYDRQLQQAADDKFEHPGDAFFATNYSGLRKQCLDAVGQYNAAANKISQARFRDVNLPYQVTDDDPATDCRENIQHSVTPTPGATK